MIYLLAALVTVFVIAGFIGGAILIGYGLAEGAWREPIAGVLIIVSMLTILYAAIDHLDNPKEHCGVGTTYIESGNTDWYCKVDKDY